MNILLLLIPLGLGLLAIALGFFLWAVRNGQLENLDQEGMRIIFDEDAPPTAAADAARDAAPGDATDAENEK